MGRQKIRGTCPLCAERGLLEREDVIPEWLRSEYSTRHIGGGQLPSRTVMMICHDCNHLLGETFENVTAPILRRIMWSRTEVVLGQDDQLTVARWLVKTDALLALFRGVRPAPGYVVIDPDGSHLLVQAVMQMAREETFLPAGAIVRVGLINPGIVWSRNRSSFLPRTALTSIGASWISSIMMTGLLISQTELLTTEDGDRDLYLREIAQDERLAFLAPSSGEITLSPSLGSDHPAILRSSYGHRSENVIGGDWILAVRR